MKPHGYLGYILTLTNITFYIFSLALRKHQLYLSGGIDFAIEFSSPDDEGGVALRPLGRRIRLIATRNSEGQTVSKIFSEKLIVTEFVKSISGNDPERSDEMLSTLASVDSVFHKWMG